MSLAALPRRALRAGGLRLALAALLLVAQHGALTHAFAHADLQGRGEAIHAHEPSAAPDADHPEHAPAGDIAEFCAFDLVYSQILGGIHASHALAFVAAEQVLVVAAAIAVRNPVVVVPYDSRGPPVLS